MILAGVDPGPTQSAVVVYNGLRVLTALTCGNKELRGFLADHSDRYSAVVLELVESFGMVVGRDVFGTVLETGRFLQIVEDQGGVPWMMPRREVKLHLCQSSRAKDSNIRQALVDRFGESKRAAIGLKRSPGPLYGVKAHEWSALALAVTWFDKYAKGTNKHGEKESEEGGKEGSSQSKSSRDGRPRNHVARKPGRRVRRHS